MSKEEYNPKPVIQRGVPLYLQVPKRPSQPHSAVPCLPPPIVIPPPVRVDAEIPNHPRTNAKGAPYTAIGIPRKGIRGQVNQGRQKLDAIIRKDKAWRAAKEARKAIDATNRALNLADPSRKKKREPLKPTGGQDWFDVLPAVAIIAHKTRGERKAEKDAKRRKLKPSWKTALKARRDRSAEYAAYISSDAWKMFRLTIFAQRGKKCEDCGETQGILHVHHLHYRNFKHEKPEDVKVLCVSCHEAEHEKLARR